MIRAKGVGPFVAALLVGSAAIATAQGGAGVVAGSVRSATGQPVERVSISVVDTAFAALRAVSDDSGRFRLAGIPGGTTRVIATRLGFYPETLTVTIVSSEVARLDFTLQPQAAQLQAERVEADPMSGKMGPFNRRRSRGVGAFITRADIEKRPVTTLSELLRYLPGVGVQQRMAGEPQPIRMQRSVNSTMQTNCAVALYVDGHPYPNGNVDDFAPGGVEGIEVYRSASEIPADFRTRGATCGVISIWTRDPEAARGKP